MTMGKEAKIFILAFIVLMGFALAVGYHYFRGEILGEGYPANTFLYLPGNYAMDFRTVVKEGQSLDPYLGYKSAQYPLLVIAGYLFSFVHGLLFQNLLFAIVVSTPLLYFSVKFLKVSPWYLSLLPIFSIIFLSYPYLIEMDRLNFEGLLFVFLLLFMFFFSEKKYLISAFFLSIAVAMKAYPAILLVLFLPERKFREIAFCIGSTIILTMASLFCFHGGIYANLTYLIHGSNITSNSIFDRFTSIGSNTVQRGVTLLTLFKIIYYEAGLLPGFIVDHFSIFYLILAAILGGLIALDVVFIERELWKRVALLVFAMLLLPPISADYKLLHIYLPLFLFINSTKSSKLDLVFVLAFGTLLIPKDLFYLSHVISEGNFYDISISVVINILILLGMSIMIMISGVRKHFRQYVKPLPTAAIPIENEGI
jgi:hypothetical protein